MAKEIYYTIEDSRYTAERAEYEGLITLPKNWHKLNHLELVAIFEEHNIKMHKKPRPKVLRSSR